MILTADDVEEWPAGRLERLLKAGFLHEAANARSVVCDACAEGHVEEVQLLESPRGSGFRGYIVCPENGRVHVPLARLRQWEIDLSGLAQALATALPAAGGHEEVVSGRVWLVGKSALGGQSRDVFLVRGAAWSDFRAVVARARRFQEATNPVVLVADTIPSQEIWGEDVPTAFAMQTLARLEGSCLTVDRDQMNRVLGRGRRRAAPVSVVTVPTPQGAQWEDLSLVVDEFEFAFQVLGKRGKRGFKDCGCENRVKGDFPDHVWALLRLFARDRGRLVEDALEPKMRDNLKQYVSELRKRLQAVFPAIGGDPIVKPPGERYKTAFRITARDGVGIDTRVVILPLEEKHRHARQELADRFGLEAAVGPRELAKRLEGRPQGEIAEAERLLSEAKFDVNEYFAAGHSAEEFEGLLARAQTPLEFAIWRLPRDSPEEQRNRLLEPILQDIAALPPLEQNRYLKQLQEYFGKDTLPLAAVREQVRAIQKQRRAHGPRRCSQRWAHARCRLAHLRPWP